MAAPDGVTSNYRSIAAVAVMFFGSAMMGLAVHHVLAGGTCSSTGYTRYGPAPVCSSSSSAWGIVLPVGLTLIIAAGALGGANLFMVLGPLFLMFGIGALTVSPDQGSTGPPSSFLIVFGGCFAVAGAGILVAPVLIRVRAARAHPPSAVQRPRPDTGRMVVAAVAWIGALVLALAVGSLFPKDHVVKTDAAGTPVVKGSTAFFRPPELSPADASSLFRTANFERSLRIARYILGAHARVRSLRLVPGGVDIAVTVDGRGKEISLDDTGGELKGPDVTLKGTEPTFALSALDASTPMGLVSELGESHQLPSAHIEYLLARPATGGGIEWLVYPTGGGRPYRAGNGDKEPISH
jgi:hypothetical protein